MSRDKQIIEIKECIDAVYGADCAYFDVDGFAIANEIYNAGYRKSTEVAEEIFEEIEKIRLQHIKKYEFFRNGSIEEIERKYYEGAEWGLRQLTYFLAELKKKYIGKDTNVITNTEEGK